MDTFSIAGSLSAGWDIFKKRPWFLIGAPIILYILVFLLSAIFSEIAKMVPALGFVTAIANITLNILVGMGMVHWLLKAHDDPASVTLWDFWYPQSFWNFVGAGLLAFLLTLVGFVLLIVPGIMIALALSFVRYLVIDRNLGPIEALKESARLTRGHRWALLGLFLMTALVNIVGALLLVVGLLVTIPVTSLAIVHAYRTLQQKAGAVAPVA